MFVESLSKNTNTLGKMQTNQEMRDKWLENYEHGDYTQIAKKVRPKSTPATIQRIMLGNPPYKDKAPTKLVLVINKFYTDRHKVIKSMK